MKKSVKLLFYCTKGKIELFNTDKGFVLSDFGLGSYYKDVVKLNGKVVAESDCDLVEEIFYERSSNGIPNSYYNFFYTETENNIENKSCLNEYDLLSYLKPKEANGSVCGYAIHLKNVKPFDEPKELSEYYKDDFLQDLNVEDTRIHKAPKNMMYCYDKEGNLCVLISIRPEYLCKILNGEKTIEVRKSILNSLKELIK